jgi:amino acid transporter
MSLERDTSGRDAWGERLPRHLGLWSTTAVLITSVIGSGIFRVPATVAGQLGSPGPALLAWALGGAIALCGALTMAELAAAMPRSGGVFAYILEAFGPMPAFLFGWAELTVIRASALGAISTIFAEYLGYFLHFSPMQVRYVAAGAIVLVATFNYVGINFASAVINMTTPAKYGALAALALLAFLAGDGSPAHFQPLWRAGVGPSLLATALVSIMWSYDGWGDLAFIGGEVKDPGRNLPRALIMGTGAIVVVYLLVNLAYIYLVPISEMAGARLIAATAAERIPLLGGAGAAVVSAIVMVSCFGTLNGSMLTGPRVFFAMADRGLFFQGIARVSPRFRTPSTAIGLAATLGVIYVLRNDFQALADKFVLGIWPFYALAVAGVYRLRRTRPDMPRPYRAIGYPVVPALFLLGAVGMVMNALVTDLQDTWVTFAIIAAGIPAYYAWRLVTGRSRPITESA